MMMVRDNKATESATSPGDNGDVSKEKRKYDKEDSRKRKFHQRKYDNSYDKFRRTDPPSAPSMF